MADNDEISEHIVTDGEFEDSSFDDLLPQSLCLLPWPLNVEFGGNYCNKAQTLRNFEAQSPYPHQDIIYLQITFAIFMVF